MAKAFGALTRSSRLNGKSVAAPRAGSVADSTATSHSSSFSFSLLWGYVHLCVRIHVCIYIHTANTWKTGRISNRWTNSTVHIHLQFVQTNSLITPIGTFPVKTLHYLSSHSGVQLLKCGLQTTYIIEAKFAVTYRALWIVVTEKPGPSRCILALNNVCPVQQSSLTASLVLLAFAALKCKCILQSIEMYVVRYM